MSLSPRIDTIEAKYSPSGVVGATSGATIGTGVVGQIIRTGAMSSTTVSTGTYVDITGASISLTPGVWAIHAYFLLRAGGSQATASCHVFDGSNTLVGGNASASLVAGSYQSFQMVVHVNIASTTTYKLRLGATAATTLDINNDRAVTYDTSADFYAIRVA